MRPLHTRAALQLVVQLYLEHIQLYLEHRAALKLVVLCSKYILLVSRSETGCAVF